MESEIYYDDEIAFIKEEFSRLCGETISFNTIHSKPSDSIIKFQQSKFEIRDEVVAEEVHKYLISWIETSLNNDNIRLVTTAVLNDVAFTDQKQFELYRKFILYLENVLGDFSNDIENKVDGYMFYHGSQERTQLVDLLNAEMEGGFDDLDLLELDENNIFTRYIEPVAAAAFQKLTTLYSSDNKAIFQKELPLVQECVMKITNLYHRKLSTYIALQFSDTIEEINHRLTSSCIKAFKTSLESPEKINTFLVQVIEQLMAGLQHVFQKLPKPTTPIESVQSQDSQDASLSSSSMQSRSPAETESEIIEKLFNLYVLSVQIKIKGVTDPNQIFHVHVQAVQDGTEYGEYTKLSDESRSNLSQRQNNYVENVLRCPPQNQDNEWNQTRDSTEAETMQIQDSSILIFHLSNKFEVTMAIQQRPSRGAYKVVSNHLGEMSTAGLVAYSFESGKMVIGSEARLQHDIQKENRNMLFWHLFKLICTDLVEEKLREASVQTFFLILRIHAEKMLGTACNQVIIIFPDWVPEYAQSYVYNVLHRADFAKIKTLTETTAVSAAYLEARCALIPPPMDGWNWPFQIFTQTHGFTQVTIVGAEWDEQPIKCLALANNWNEIKHSFLSWYANSFENPGDAEIETSFADWREKSNQVYADALEIFKETCARNKRKAWLQSKLDCVVITEPGNLPQIEALLAERGRAKVNRHQAFANWKQLVLQGATLYSFEGTELLNIYLFGKQGTRRITTIPESSTISSDSEKSTERTEQLKQKCGELLNFIKLNQPRLSDQLDATINDMIVDIEEAEREMESESATQAVEYYETIINMHGQHFKSLMDAAAEVIV